MYEETGVVAIRRIQGILALARKHGAALADDDCAAALESGVILKAYTYHFVAAGSNEGRSSRCARWTPSSAS